MLGKAITATGLGLVLAWTQLAWSQDMEQEGGATQSAVTCEDLDWSARVLAINPDIAESCRAVYEKDGRLYAQAKVEVVRVRGNTITFRPLHTDGTKGDSRSVTVDGSWRARIAGRSYRASDLMRGQELDVYLPEDRFALHIGEEAPPGDVELLEIEEEVIEMPTTASPLFLVGLAGAGFLALGGVFAAIRRRFA